MTVADVPSPVIDDAAIEAAFDAQCAALGTPHHEHIVSAIESDECYQGFQPAPVGFYSVWKAGTIGHDEVVDPIVGWTRDHAGRLRAVTGDGLICSAVGEDLDWDIEVR